VNVFDEREMEIPNMGMIRIKNAETGQRMWVDSSRRKVREIFRERSQNKARSLNDTFRRSGVDVVNIRTDQDYVKPLIGLFRKRTARK
jgi:hypothetical protein